MSDSERTSIQTPPDPAPVEGARVYHFPGAREPAPHGAPPGPRHVRIRKLRVLALLVGLGALALVSTVFGMMMAVASDLPALEEPGSRNSVLLDRSGKVELGLLTGNERRLYLSEEQIAPVMKHAIIAIEDRRFYTNDGVDIRGIARAFTQDIAHRGAVQGGSTITQQFVKNALAAQDQRTLFVKLKEAALAYHLTRKWSKERILRNYLNTIYFGNGAYGIESAARTYFGRNHPGCDRDKARPCASQLAPQEAALLAGMVASPSGFDPLQHPAAAQRRRDLVLLRMRQQNFLTQSQYLTARAEALPSRADVEPPREDTKYPYFTSWVKQQVVDRLGGGQEGARLAFEGGLQVRTTLDAKLQDAAQAAVDAWLPNPAGPRASLVAISNKTGEVRAMIGGDDYAHSPFNLATQGQRQPGSSFKPFVLAEALRQGISPVSTWTSRKKVFVLKGGERFTVNNYADEYAGITTLANATTTSDNSVFAEVGMKVGPARIARLAQRMGIRTRVSHNAAIALGGLRRGVTPLDMAHAYETFANGGRLTYGSLSPGADQKPGRFPVPGPTGIDAIGRDSGGDFSPVKLPDGEKAVNRTRTRRILTAEQAATIQGILQSVVRSGTATRAQIPGIMIAGKTGTTEDYGDAWFVGWTKAYTVAVWVGYPDRFQPMKTEFQGGPVAGGTFPAGIWKTFMESELRIYPPKEPDANATGSGVGVPPTEGGAPAPQATAAPTVPAAPAPAPSSGTGGGSGATGAAGGTGTVPSTPAPAPTPVPAPATPVPTAAPPSTPPAGGGTGTTGATGTGGTGTG